MALRKGSLCALVVPLAGTDKLHIVPGQIIELLADNTAVFWDSVEDIPHKEPRALQILKPLVTSISDAEVGTVFIVRVDNDPDNNRYTYIEDEAALEALQAVEA